MTCAACGQSASGRFCNNCGAPLVEQRCKSCGTTLSAGARFCHLCGTPTAVRQNLPSSNANLGWIVGGIAAVALVVVIGSRFMNRPQPTPQAPFAGTAAAGAAPDISSMTPRERADRLFERIMIADSRGFSDTVAFFTPMALNAYGLLGNLDIDARYHVGLIEALAGNVAAVRAQADSIRAQVPTHLMASMLDFAAYRLESDTSEMNRVYREFLSNYGSETASGRQEYTAHETALNAFLQDAQAASSGASGGAP